MYESTFYATRQPLLPLNKLLKFYDIAKHHKSQDILDYLVKEFTSNYQLEEALYLASDVLYSELIKYKSIPSNFSDKEKNRMLHSLTKYYIRASARATPFGLFGNFREGSFDIEGNNNASNILEYHPKLDMEVLYQISEHILSIDGVKTYLTLSHNTSLYKTNDDFRYVEYRIKNGLRTHHLVSIKSDSLLNFVIKVSKKGIGYDALIIELLNNYDVDKEDIERYVDDLISCKLLITNLDINITGKDYFEILSDFISNVSPRITNDKILAVKNILQKINSLLLQINHEQSNVSFYKKIHELLKQFLPHIPEKNLIQLDVTSKKKDFTLPLEIKSNLNNLLNIFSTFSKSYSTENFQLEIFKRAFYERYENRMMKLTEVLDEELGIGYKSAISIKDIHNSKRTDKNKLTGFVLKKYHQYLKKKEEYIELNDIEIKEYFGNVTDSKNVSPSFTYLLNAYPKKEGSLFRIISYSPSTTSLSGRFCGVHKEYYKKLNDLTNHIENQQSDYVYAEIVHLPQARVGNVIGRPYFGNYEIPYLSTSLLPESKKIIVDDLYIQMINKELYLFSKSLNKPIRPRLSNAHNYRKDGLPIYHFLSDMQYQNLDFQVIWDWSILEESEEYFPRVVYKNIILQEAYWTIKDKNFADLKKAKNFTDFKKKISELRQKLNIADWVVFKERDNVLYLDLSTDIGIELIQKYVNQNNKQIILHESLLDKKHELPDSAYNKELVVPFVNFSQKVAPSLKRKKISKDTVTRNFIPGSEWIYFKIYIEHKFSNKLLVILGDYIEKKLINKGLIEKWFFIRYSDPKQHIRLRLYTKDLSTISTVVTGISNIFKHYGKSGKISSITQDSYQRELERYGDKNIIKTESLFYINSKLVYYLYKSFKTISYNNLFFISYFMIEKYLETLSDNNLEKLKFLSENFNYYAKEFNYENDKTIRNSLHEELRKIKNINVEEVLDKDTINIINQSKIKNALLEIKNDVKSDYFRILASYIHMSINRLFYENQRFNEFKLYFFLYKKYQSIIARENFKNNI
ncbi:lantibiotic dehydratase [Chryseobacterium aquaticum]|uniref:Lantibiotic dehydratase n=1 Tax=Chryseobacterium aquaticum TaxID=452084 RepID=A0A848N2K9_9FLAO|nr:MULTISPECIES: lantibiotic dehydratase [Chryseobacterium]NMR33764.1 lantibiotic dehydratase [Chryseobacterium aquaticum]NRQ45840.1 lantibiotic dehydratase [Chryseobacterium sp. C-204]